MERSEIKEALQHMYMAQEILFRQLRNPDTLCREVAEGLDCLFRAIEIAEKPEENVHVCAECGSISFDMLENGRLICLSCDSELSETSVMEVC